MFTFHVLIWLTNSCADFAIPVKWMNVMLTTYVYT